MDFGFQIRETSDAKEENYSESEIVDITEFDRYIYSQDDNFNFS
jgi:hypothetical protein